MAPANNCMINWFLCIYAHFDMPWHSIMESLFTFHYSRVSVLFRLQFIIIWDGRDMEKMNETLNQLTAIQIFEYKCTCFMSHVPCKKIHFFLAAVVVFVKKCESWNSNGIKTKFLCPRVLNRFITFRFIKKCFFL